MNDSIRLDLVDAIEIAETLEYLIERLERFARHDPAGLLANNDDDTYSLDDLRTDVVRLTNKLLTSPNESYEIGG
jgi:hypothetical protein